MQVRVTGGDATKVLPLSTQLQRVLHGFIHRITPDGFQLPDPPPDTPAPGLNQSDVAQQRAFYIAGIGMVVQWFQKLHGFKLEFQPELPEWVKHGIAPYV